MKLLLVKLGIYCIMPLALFVFYFGGILADKEAELLRRKNN